MDAFGPWAVLDRLGQGAMGVVWRARHRQTGVFAAVKVASDLSHASAWILAEETEQLARLSHPGIVEVLDHGTQDGTPWVALELLPGETLRHLVGARDSSPALTWGVDQDWHPIPVSSQPAGMDVARAVDLACALCSPLAWLHGLGWVHRDLKLDNVLLRSDGTPVLADFGLLTRFAAPTGRELAETGAQRRAGTPDTLAPEVILGETVDPRADLYALGCVLYELLSGRPPFVGGTVNQILNAHLHEQPATLAELGVAVPDELEVLVRSLLSKDPAQRPGHADDVEAVLTALGGRPMAGAPEPRPWLQRPSFRARTAELDGLVEHLDAAFERRGGQVWVQGAPGIGKTRLIVALAREAAKRGARVVAGGVRGLLRAVADELDPHTRSVLALIEPLLGTPLPVGDQPVDELRIGIYATLVHALDLASLHAPLVLLLDGHAAEDSDNVAWLAWLMTTRELADRRVLLLLAGGQPTAGAPQIELEPLTPDAIADIGTELVAMAIPEELVRGCEGNPSDVLELLKASLEDGWLSRQDGRWVASRWPSTVHLPDLVQRRMRHLSPQAIDAGIRVALSGTLPPDIAGHGVAALLRLGWLTTDVDGHVHFVDDRVRRIWRDRVGNASSFHRTLADAFRQAGAEPRVIAPHLQGAGDLTAARVAWRAAVEDAVERGHVSEELNAREAWLSCKPPSAEVPEACVALASRCVEAGRLDRVDKLLRIVEQTTSPDDQTRLRMRLVRAQAAMASGDHEAAANESAAVAEALGRLDSPQAAEAWVVAAGNALTMRRHKAAREAAEQAIEAAVRHEMPVLEAFGHLRLAGALQPLGEPEQAGDALERAEALLDAHGRPNQVALLLHQKAVHLQRIQRMEEAGEVLERAVDVRRRLGEVQSLSASLGNLGALYLHLARFEVAGPVLDEALTLQERSGHTLYQAYNRYYRALGHRMLGEYDEAEAHLKTAMELSRQAESLLDVHDCLVEGGFLALARGEDAGAWLEAARRLHATEGLEAGEDPNEGKLARAIAAAEAGRELIHGALPEEMPPRWRAHFGVSAPPDGEG